MSALRRYLYVVLGTLSLGLALVGIVLPLVPTTPLLLLAAACYARGSRRFHGWLMHNRLVGRYLRDYREGRAMTRPAKAFVLLLMWVVIGASAAFVVQAWWARALLLLVAASVSVHIVSLRVPRR